MSSRQSSLACLCIAACVLGWVVGCRGEQRDDGFNIILVSLDTLRADHLGLYGYARETSPQLDLIASEAVVFDMAIAQASATGPSHRSFFTSRYPRLAKEESTYIAELLRAAGYLTAAFTGGGNVSSEFGFDVGFDTYFEAAKPKQSLQEAFPRFEEWVRAHADERFFVFLHSYDIHHPYSAPAEFERFFSPDYSGPMTVAASAEVLTKTRRVGRYRDFTGAPPPLSGEDREHIVALYDGGIRYADTYMGKLRALLEELSLSDRTALIILSDHGEEFWDHGSVLHSFTLYQELIRVPLILRMPSGRFAGHRLAEPVSLLDVSPTILELAGLPPSELHQGQSLLQRIADREAARLSVSSPIASETGKLRSVIAWPWKLINEPRTGIVKMYNLDRDSAEREDLALVKQREASQLYQRLLTQVGDLGGGIARESEETIPEDENLREQLRVLGYIE